MVNPQPGVNTIDVHATLLSHDARLTRVEEDVSALSGLPEAVASLHDRRQRRVRWRFSVPQ